MRLDGINLRGDSRDNFPYRGNVYPVHFNLPLPLLSHFVFPSLFLPLVRRARHCASCVPPPDEIREQQENPRRRFAILQYRRVPPSRAFFFKRFKREFFYLLEREVGKRARGAGR